MSGTRVVRWGAFYRSLPMMAAEQKGFYADRDIEIDYGQVTSSTQQFEYLRDGGYDVVQTSPDNTANYRYNENTALGGRLDAQGFLGLDYSMLLIVVAQPQFARLEDLRGGNISVDAVASGFAYVMYEILARAGLERDRDYTVVSHGGVFDRYKAMVIDKEDIAATLMSGGFETRAARQGFNLLDSVHDIADPYLGVWAAARSDWLEQNAELVGDMVDGYQAATEWVFDPAHREECLDMLMQLPNTERDLAEELYEIQLRPGVGNVPDGSIDPEAIRNVLAMRQRFGGFEDDHDLDALVGQDSDLINRTWL